MSTGKLSFKKKVHRDNPIEQNISDIIHEIVPTFEVEVDDSEWERADENLKEKITTLGTKLKAIEEQLGSNQGNLSDAIKELKKEIENLKVRKPLDLIVKIDNSKTQDLGKQHFQLPTLLQILATKLNVYIVGPAGSGKTTAAIQCAKALDIDFYFTGAVASEFKLTGFIDAQGRIVSTEFRKAFENGGLFLFDEIDASYPQAVLAFNAALANDYMDFPDKRISRHENFYCIAAANTYGQGADRQYVGRNQLDAASLDRFVFLDWKYDENLERDLAGNQDWSDYVQKIRRYIEAQKIRHVVSPRASIFGAKLLANGMPRDSVEQTILWKGLDETTKNKILENIAPKKVQASRDGKFIPKVKVGDKVNEDDIIGEIKYKYNSYGRYYTDTDNVLAPYNGIILSIMQSQEVKDEEVIAEIESYGN
ncbi:ATPase family associated with various cellular activities (AAA) [Bacteroidales bacterium Barb4]|nr:ATPase family associated with various cellular activities (AAA) [Bacteroidales bacterium Barb4]